MAKKEKIHLQHSSDLEAIDVDLAAAMDTLDAKNQQINELLSQFDPPPANGTSDSGSAPPQATEELKDEG